MRNSPINFSQDKFEELIINIGWKSYDDWINFWQTHESILSINDFWGGNVNEEWIWGLALPLLSQAYNLKTNFTKRSIIGISALPGTGKTTLGRWLEAISLKLNFNLAVISIDDFYLPAKEMELTIKDNPWNVSRGFPGSHSINLMHEKLNNWKLNGQLNVPVFDKSLRNGLGDRSHWRTDCPDLLILEGWFLGAEPLLSDINNEKEFLPALSSQEYEYRLNIQKNLHEYLEIWNLIDFIWHLKPLKFEYMNLWKSRQEEEMLLKKGNALKDKKLSNFLRMLNVSIPHKCFEEIKSDILLLIDENRKIVDFEFNLKNS